MLSGWLACACLLLACLHAINVHLLAASVLYDQFSAIRFAVFSDAAVFQLYAFLQKEKECAACVAMLK